MNCEERHDKLVYNLENRLNKYDSGWVVTTHKYYKLYGNIREMDLQAVKGNYRITIEVKCNAKYRNNAKKQLRRARDSYFPSAKRDWYFYAHYNNYFDDNDYTIKRLKIK